MKRSKRDWSDEDLRKHLIDARKFMWRDSTIARIAGMVELKKGNRVVDAGCGLGYLGWTLRPYYGNEGSYIGVDCSQNLLREASKLAVDWQGEADVQFVRGSAYRLPLPDSSSDLTMCQTLLMHLEHPDEALDEMIRITRPGAAVMCIEPDNISAMLTVPWCSDMDLSDSELLRRFRMNIIWARGRKRLGRGDWGIGRKLPKMLADHGLCRVDVVHNDMPHFINPPYETGFQKYRLEKMMESIEEADDEDETQKVRDREWKECYLAGGGSLSTFYRNRKTSKESWEKRRPILKKQLEEGTFFAGLAGSHFYCVFGFREEL